jgi:heme/copper-type cytochrome/quinol oxidase subunit 2
MVAEGYIVERTVFEVIATISCLIGFFQIYARLLPENRGKIRLVQKWFFPVAFGLTIIGVILFIDYRCVFGIHNATSIYTVMGLGSVLPIPGALFWLKNAYETVSNFTSSRLPFQIQPYAIYVVTFLHLLCVSILLPALFSLKGTIGAIFGWTLWLTILVLFVFLASIIMTLVVRRTAHNERRIAGGSSTELHRVYRRLIVVSILLVILIAAMSLAIIYNYPIREKPLKEACGFMSPDVYRMTPMNYSFHVIWMAIVITTYILSWLHVPLRRVDHDIPTGNKSKENMNIEVAPTQVTQQGGRGIKTHSSGNVSSPQP